MGRLVAYAGVLSTFLLALLVPGFQFDFSFEWLTARAVLSGLDPHVAINDLASALGLSSRLTFIAPRLPGVLILQAPFGLIPFEWMYEAGRIITVAAAVWLAWLTAKWARVPAIWLFALLPLILVVWPFSRTVLVSQYASFVVAALIGLTMASRDRFLSGVPLGIAVSFKLWPWLIAPALWLSGRRKTAVGAGAAFLLLNGAGLLLPNVSLAGTLSGLASVSGFPSLSPSARLGIPVWISVIAGLGLLWIANRYAHAHIVRLSVVIALLTAPMLAHAYLPVLVVLLIRPDQLKESSVPPDHERLAWES